MQTSDSLVFSISSYIEDSSNTLYMLSLFILSDSSSSLQIIKSSLLLPITTWNCHWFHLKTRSWKSLLILTPSPCPTSIISLCWNANCFTLFFLRIHFSISTQSLSCNQSPFLQNVNLIMSHILSSTFTLKDFKFFIERKMWQVLCC